MTRAEALREATGKLARAGCPEPRAEAEVLLAHVLGVARPMLLLDRGAPLGTRAGSAFARAIARRLRREPVAYITGEREFWSLSFRVTRSVLIPRPETEILVQAGLELLEKEGFHGATPGRKGEHRPRVIDVGTGSGCVAVAVTHTHPRARVVALDRSARALAVAAKNAARHRVAGRVTLLQADLFHRHAGRRGGEKARERRIAPANLVLSNPPYVTPSEWRTLAPDIRDWEPRQALLGGRDGLDLQRRLAFEAAGHLLPGGWIAVEVGAGQAEAVAALYRACVAFTNIRIWPDLAGTPRVVAARKKD